MRLRIAILAVGLVTYAVAAADAQVSSVTARTMGLETAWISQIQLPRVGSGLVSSHLWAESKNPRKYAVVELADRTIRVSAEALNRDGEPIGIEEAKQQAQQQAARYLGKSDGFQVVEVNVPQLKLVLITSDGLVQVLDAESGKLIWATACGRSTAPAHAGAVSTAGVSLIHGENLYLLDWATGKHIMSKHLRYSTSNAVAVCNDIAFVSDFTGRVEAYGLGTEHKPWGYVMQGRSVGRPVNLASQHFSAIASDAGYVYIFAGGNEPNVWIRYETSSPISGSLSAGNGAFYAGTTAGLVSKITVDERLGRVKWEYRTGKTVTAPPLVVGDLVVAATESGDVVAIDDNTGVARWEVPGLGAAGLIGMASSKVIGLSGTGELLALDADSGRVVGRSIALSLSKPVINQMNDRIYLVQKNGRVQCLRPIDGVLPTMVTAPTIMEDESGESAPVTEQPTAPPGENPFNFGGGDAMSDGENPFGGDAGIGDPFGGAGGDGGDPFGGTGGSGGDPFGGTGSGDSPFSGDPFGGSGN